MMKKLLATAALTVSAAALAGPAHAAVAAPAHPDGEWTAADTAACATDLVVIPLVNAVSPLPLRDPAPACGEGSLIHPGAQGARQTSV
ncbi:hypothetical protein AB0L59_21335 [Streptomyces sp. NPDC052109]|uniref:hypothetical protein n=1 Tax=Streptomyces sp. NPDC052109 TaxID=3155527 RepID=UPI00342FD1FC